MRWSFHLPAAADPLLTQLSVTTALNVGLRINFTSEEDNWLTDWVGARVHGKEDGPTLVAPPTVAFLDEFDFKPMSDRKAMSCGSAPVYQSYFDETIYVGEPNGRPEWLPIEYNFKSHWADYDLIEVVCGRTVLNLAKWAGYEVKCEPARLLNLGKLRPKDRIAATKLFGGSL